jgi:hypothetical protein
MTILPTVWKSANGLIKQGADTAATCGAMAGQGGPTHASRDSLSFLSRALRRGVHLNAKVLRVPLTRDLTRSFYSVVLIFLSTPTLCCTGRGPSRLACLHQRVFPVVLLSLRR